jgi:hypothetical protein
MTISRHLAALYVAALVLLAAAAPADAANNAMPGTACQAAGDSPPSSLVRSASSILNLGSSSVAIFCPVEKHLSRIVSAEVMLIDRNPNADIFCSLLTFNRDGSTRTSNTQNSNSTFNVALALTFPGQLTPTGVGSYGLVCILPPSVSSGASSIVGYTIVEQ